MSGRYVYKLCGGPYSGREVLGEDQEWRVELYHQNPYAEYSVAKAIYGSRVLQINTSPRLLYYWGSQSANPEIAHEPLFYS